MTYILLKTQSIFWLATSRKGQPDSDLHTVQNPEHAHVTNKQGRPARCWLTFCSNPRACSCQQQAEMARKMLTYMLFKSRPWGSGKKQAGRASQMLTYSLSRARQYSGQLQVRKARLMLTYKLFKTKTTLVSNKQDGQADGDLQPVWDPDHALVSNTKKGLAMTYFLFEPKTWSG